MRREDLVRPRTRVPDIHRYRDGAAQPEPVLDGIRTRQPSLRTIARLPDFRHTVVTLPLELGTPPHVVQTIAQDADLDVALSIYAHPNLDAMREALDKIDGVME